VLVSCGHILVGACPACAERYRIFRAAQCRESWHLEDELLDGLTKTGMRGKVTPDRSARGIAVTRPGPAAPPHLSWPGPGRGRVLAGPPVPGGGMIAVAGLALAPQ
jgi:hypothetical protein